MKLVDRSVIDEMGERGGSAFHENAAAFQLDRRQHLCLFGQKKVPQDHTQLREFFATAAESAVVTGAEYASGAGGSSCCCCRRVCGGIFLSMHWVYTVFKDLKDYKDYSDPKSVDKHFLPIQNSLLTVS